MKTKINTPTKSLLLCASSDVDLEHMKGETFVPLLYNAMAEKDIIDHGLSYIEEDDGDPVQFITQYKYIGKIYDQILDTLVDSLNTLHQKTWTTRQWELVVGPWLRHYLETLYIRWVRLDLLLKLGISKVYILDTCRSVNETFIAANRNDYAINKIMNEHWNNCMMSRMALFKFSDQKNIELITIEKEFTTDKKQEKKRFKKFSSFGVKRFMKFFIQRSLEVISIWLSRKNIIVINNPYLSVINKLRLAFFIKKMPVFYFNRMSNLNSSITAKSRKFQIPKYKCYDDFHNFAYVNLVKEIPTCYVENWVELEKEVDDINLPPNPDIIYTGSGVETDELIRIFIARNIINSTKYIISQHGGVYGTRLIPTKSEFYEHRVTDRWISWGWTDPNNEKIKPGINIKEIGRKYINSSKRDKILFTLPNITYLPSRLMPLQPLMRINESQRIVQGFNDYVRRYLVIRPHPNHRKTHYVKSIADGCEVSLKPDFWNDLIKCKLFITTNNSTTFLQAINADCPSVLILSGRQKMIREISRETFALLEEVGIVFTDIQLAINHINIISRNPEEWWRSDAVQKAKSAFCLQHTNTSKNAINKLFKLFN